MKGDATISGCHPMRTQHEHGLDMFSVCSKEGSLVPSFLSSVHLYIIVRLCDQEQKDILYIDCISCRYFQRALRLFSSRNRSQYRCKA
jgi:hypothetical protein